jgi:pimeloyl-ACP methyl ester carboxylesterase
MMSLDAWRASGSWFEWRGERIFSRTEGTGEPLLLVHGFPTASWDWAAVWPRLAARYRVLAIDMIGFGLSAKPRGFAYSIMAQADLFQAFLAREGVTRYRVLAHDYGNTVAQELLARDRGAIIAACFLNGGLFPEAHRPLPLQRLLASPIGPLVARFASYRTFAASMHRIWGSHPLPDDELRTMWELASGGGGLAIMPKLLGYMAERRRHRARWVGALVDAKVPCRLIDGLDDPVSGAHLVARYRTLVGLADVVELPGVGHYPQVEAPEAVTAAALAFFASVD